MTVWVDDARIPAKVGRFDSRWSHLMADTEEELHEFAKKLGLQRSWFQVPKFAGKPVKPNSRSAQNWHYDVTDAKRRQAIRMGAQAVTSRELSAIIDARYEREYPKEAAEFKAKTEAILDRLGKASGTGEC